MKVFISWSGQPSHEVADLLTRWLSDFNVTIEPWVSSQIQAGTQWRNDIITQLETTELGIICLTRANERSQWLNFEAGALSKAASNAATKVIPLLLDFPSQADFKGPLVGFQNVRPDRDGLWRIVKSINSLLESKMGEGQLARVFERLWPEFERDFAQIELVVSEEPPAPRTTEREVAEEILETVRRIEQSAIAPYGGGQSTRDYRVKVFSTLMQGLLPHEVFEVSNGAVDTVWIRVPSDPFRDPGQQMLHIVTLLGQSLNLHVRYNIDDSMAPF